MDYEPICNYFDRSLVDPQYSLEKLEGRDSSINRREALNPDKYIT